MENDEIEQTIIGRPPRTVFHLKAEEIFRLHAAISFLVGVHDAALKRAAPQFVCDEIGKIADMATRAEM